MTDVRATQAAFEVLQAGVPAVRASQASIEVLFSVGIPDTRVSQAVVEVLVAVNDNPYEPFNIFFS